MKIEELLRKFVLQVLSEEKDKEDNLLGEPDLSKEDEREEDGEEAHHDEQNVVANIAGVTTPLGTGPSYPNKSKRKKNKKSQDDQDKDWYK